MNRNLRNTLSLGALALLIWQCRSDRKPEQREVGQDEAQAVGAQAPDQLLLPFHPGWNAGNPPLLYYGRELRYLDLRQHCQKVLKQEASEKESVFPQATDARASR